MREAIVSGKFYPFANVQLQKTIEECFMHKLGKGRLPDKCQKINKKTELKAIISPHAGYVFSGACASHVFYEVANNKTPDTYVILGLSHYGYATSLSDDDFETPFGVVKCNKELVKTISEKCKIPVNNSAHKYEHSIEVLLPFLQYVKRKDAKNIMILPLIIGRETFDRINLLAKLLNDALKNYGKSIIFIASSDFTHYGKDYGYTPIKDVKSMDMKAINMILESKKENARYLYKYFISTGITICGIFPILLLVEILALKSNKTKERKLLSYYRSSDIINTGKDSAVSYAGISFY